MYSETLTDLTFEDLGEELTPGDQQEELGFGAFRGAIFTCFLGGIIWAVIAYLLFA